MDDSLYFLRLAAAFVRGVARTRSTLELPVLLGERPLEDLETPELEEIVGLGRDSGLRLHRFKRTMQLARVQRVLGALRGIAPETLLDIGSGRGAFLWPLIDEFRGLTVTCVDKLEYRIEDIVCLREGGLESLDGRWGDATELEFAPNSFDVVTMLEVLEHIPDAVKAATEVIRVARQFVIVSVPSKEDDNPEHIHLFTPRRLQTLLEEAGATRVTFDHVPGHVVAFARVTD